MKHLITTFLLLSTSLSICAQLLEPEKLPNNWEAFVSSVPISGFKNQGVQIPSKKRLLNPTVVRVVIPKNLTTQRICLRIISIDGRYRANLSYLVDSTANSEIGLHVPTEYAKELKNYKADDLGLMATVQSNCNDNSGKVLISSWVKNSFDEEFLINFNSRKRVKLLVVKKGKIYFERLFDEIKQSTRSTVGFKKSCRVPFSVIQNDSRIIIQESWLNDDGKKQEKDYELDILFN